MCMCVWVFYPFNQNKIFFGRTENDKSISSEFFSGMLIVYYSFQTSWLELVEFK